MNELWSLNSAEVEIVSKGKRKMSGKKPESGAQKRKNHKEKFHRLCVIAYVDVFFVVVVFLHLCSLCDRSDRSVYWRAALGSRDLS